MDGLGSQGNAQGTSPCTPDGKIPRDQDHRVLQLVAGMTLPCSLVRTVVLLQTLAQKARGHPCGKLDIRCDFCADRRFRLRLI